MKWYVYTLTNPLTGRIFYVGKGQKHRMYTHYWTVCRGKVPHRNYKLFNEIRSIIAAGESIQYDKVFVSDDEQQTYDKEAALIENIGIDNLCNLYIHSGGAYSGDKHWNYGKHWGEDVKSKIRVAKLGNRHTDEAKQKISDRMRGDKHPMFGKNHTDDTKKKMSENHSDFNGSNNPFFGRSHTKEVKDHYKKLYSKKWVVTHDGKSVTCNGRKEVVEYVTKYNIENGTKISAHSMFQYGRNKHGWKVGEVN